MVKISKKETLEQTPKETIDLEVQLQEKLGFKRKWLDDNSGYWLEKSYDFLGSKIFLNFDWDYKKPIHIYIRSNQRDGSCFSYVDLMESKPKKINFERIKNIDSKIKKVSAILKFK